jgi:hypothetical protein
MLAKPPVFGFQNPTLLCFQLVNFGPVLDLLVLVSSSIARRTGALMAGLSCSTRSRRPRELVYRSLRRSVPGRL